ncbi:MAG: roadblock/LC7 domain-containing protein [Nitrospirota bacterium]
MSFEDSLKRVIEGIGEDSLGIALVGTDGIVVEEYKKDLLLDIQALGAEYCTFLKETDKISLNSGLTEELTVTNDNVIIILKRISEDYFLILVIRAGGNFGKSRFLLKRESAVLKDEL